MIRITDSHVMFAVRNHQHAPYIARIKRVLHDQLASSDSLVLDSKERTDVITLKQGRHLSPLTGVGNVPRLLLPQHEE